MAHAIKEINTWVDKRVKVLGGKIGALKVPKSYEIDEDGDGIVDEEGVGAQLVLDGKEVEEGVDQGWVDEEVLM